MKRWLYSDDRYQAVPEKRRLALFQEYREIVREIEMEEEERKRIEDLERLKAKAADQTAAAEARLAQLMEQRKRLKTEFEKIQTNLEKMERTLDSQKQNIEEKEIQNGDPTGSSRFPVSSDGS